MAEAAIADPPAASEATIPQVPTTPAVDLAPVATHTPTFAGKFTSIEELEKGYLELQKKLGGQSSTEPSDTQVNDQHGQPGDQQKPNNDVQPENLQVQAPPAEQQGGIDAVLMKAGLKPEDLTDKWSQDGNLEDAQYQALAGVGFTRPIVDDFLAGQVARAQLAATGKATAIAEAQSLAGGADQLNNLLAWAGGALGDQQRSEINDQLDNPATITTAVRALRDMHRDAVGAGGSNPLVEGGNTPAGNIRVPKTIEEYTALGQQAMNGDQAAISVLNNLPAEYPGCFA